MIVEVVLGQVEETGGGQGHGVQTPLVDAVRRRLHAEVRHASAGEVGEVGRDIGGVRSGQARRQQLLAARVRAERHAERAHARGSVAQAVEDLPAEGGDGGLAVGAGDGDHRARLSAVEGAGGQGVGAANVPGRGDGNGQFGVSFARQDGGGAGVDRRPDEGPSVDLGPRQGGEQIARPDLPAVGGDARDDRVDVEVGAEQRGKAGAHCEFSLAGALAAMAPMAGVCGAGLTPTKGAMRSIT